MRTQTKSLSIAAMTCGIVGLLLSCILIGIIPALAGLILSIVCITRKNSNKPFYITGLITSICAILFFMFMLYTVITSPSTEDPGNAEKVTEMVSETESVINTENNSNESSTDIPSNLNSEVTTIENSSNMQATDEAASQNTEPATDQNTSESPSQKASDSTPESSSESTKTSIGSDSQDEPQESYVYISETGSKYHSVPDCGRMNPDKATKMSEQDAIDRGYDKCSKCF